MFLHSLLAGKVGATSGPILRHRQPRVPILAIVINLDTITTTFAEIYAVVNNTLRSYKVHCKGASKRTSRLLPDAIS